MRFVAIGRVIIDKATGHKTKAASVEAARDGAAIANSAIKHR